MDKELLRKNLSDSFAKIKKKEICLHAHATNKNSSVVQTFAQTIYCFLCNKKYNIFVKKLNLHRKRLRNRQVY